MRLASGQADDQQRRVSAAAPAFRPAVDKVRLIIPPSCTPLPAGVDLLSRHLPILFRDCLRFGFAMKGSASAEFSATAMVSQHEGVAALVRWRLGDPLWKPSFMDLLDDARTCIDPQIEAAAVLGALKEAVITDSSLAPVARRIAIEAGRIMTSPLPAAIKRPGKVAGLLARWRRRWDTGGIASHARWGAATSRMRN